MTTQKYALSAGADSFTMHSNWKFTDAANPSWVADAPSSAQTDLIVDAGAGTDTLILDAKYQPSHFYTVYPIATGGLMVKDSGGGIARFLNFEKVVFHGSTGDALDDIFLFGFGGNDKIDGKAGNDVINGGNGNDVLIGNTGKDMLTGGSGADKFKLMAIVDSKVGSSRDVIADFVHGQDKIDVSDINGLSASSGFHTFKFIKNAAFHHVKGELHYVSINHAGTASDMTLVEGDITGDAKADFQIALKGLHSLSASDFVL
jgi:Ca2+-binding RTX toxin-like protein